jgi:hypothetical protein
MTTKYLPASTVDHKHGCRRYEVGTFTGKRGDVMARCNDCGAVKVLEAAEQREVFTPQEFVDPIPTDVDLPALVALCERRGIPVLRSDHRGDVHLIRTLADLEAIQS